MTKFSVTVIFKGVANIAVQAESVSEALVVADDKFSEGLPNKYEIEEWEPLDARFTKGGEQEEVDAGFEEDGDVSDDGKYTVGIIYRGGQTYDVQAESVEEATTKAIELLRKEPFADDLIGYGEENVSYIGADGKEVNDEFYDFDTMPTALDYMAA